MCMYVSLFVSMCACACACVREDMHIFRISQKMVFNNEICLIEMMTECDTSLPTSITKMTRNLPQHDLGTNCSQCNNRKQFEWKPNHAVIIETYVAFASALVSHYPSLSYQSRMHGPTITVL